MKVLLSIKPEFAFKIFDGTKKYEFRKSIFKRKDIESVIVYASYPVQRVIGEFKIKNILNDDLETIWEKTSAYAGISKPYYDEYFANKDTAFAIQVGRCSRYRNPKHLSDFNVSCPPQSFMYV